MSAGGEHSRRPEPEFREDWQELLATQKSFGQREGAIQIVEFVDFQCPFCMVFASTLDSLRAHYPNEVFVAIRHYPLSIHPSARIAARGAECAVQENAFEGFYRTAFQTHDSLWTSNLGAIATQAGIRNLDRFAECTSSSWADPQIVADSLEGVRVGLVGTPMVILNGWIFTGKPSLTEMTDLIDREDLVEKARR